MADPQQIDGLPEGAEVRPIDGLPQGAEVRPIRNGYSGDMTSTGIAAPQGTEHSATAGVQGAKDLLTGVAEGAANTVGSSVAGTARLLRHIPYMDRVIPEEGIKALEARTADRSAPENKAQMVGRTGEQIGEWLLPSGAEEKAAVMAGKALPRLGKVLPLVAKLGTGAVESGIRNSSQGGDFKTGAEVGAGAGVVSEGARALAPTIAESALGVTNKLRGHDRTIGESVLNEVGGIRPSTIAQQSRSKLGILTKEMEGGVHSATQAGTTVTTDAANKVLDDAIAKAPRNARTYTEKLNSLRDLLDFNQGAGPQQRVFTPDEALEMKRGIDKEISNWDIDSRKSVEPIKHQLYQAIDNELDRAAPGNEQLNQRISSLIPVKQRASILEKGAPTTQRMAHRLTAHTGALAGAGIGGAIGHERGGTAGSIAGGLIGLAVPELAAAPTTQMAVARAMRMPVVGRSILGATLQANRPSILVRQKEEEPGDEQ